MIAGLFLRHYKVYKGANYVPFGTKSLENFNLFIGQNGAGKSSILEALDTFFNNREFIIHNSEKKNEAFVAPLFLLPKEDLVKVSKNSQLIIPIISEFLNGVAETQSPVNYKPLKEFFKHQPYLNSFRATHYMFLYGIWQEPNEKCFITFDDAVKKRVTEVPELKENLGKVMVQLKQDILNYYSFQYIPVETSIEDFLRLESRGMQNLMSEDVKKRIEKTLNERLPVKAGRSQSKSILDIVNDDLDIFVSEVESIIQEIDKEYDFQKEYRSKTRLTANHLTDVVVEAFFSKRNLKKSNKLIKNLSAGERKKALIDIAYAFLTQDTHRKKKVILAIDEPESSLHISMCYEQFERLEKLASSFNTQLFITTHWYGSLPIIEKGNLFHVEAKEEDAPKISEFSFKNYFEERRSHPNDIQFKSFFDLSSALISSLRAQSSNWLVVESEEDKRYIECHLNKPDNLKILPVGGSATVKLLHDYLYTPISQKSDSKELQGKIFCMIDTDMKGVNRNLAEDLQSGILIIRRLQVSQERFVDLVRINADISSPTEIEESLIPERFYDALAATISQSSDLEIKEAFSHFEFDNGASNSFIKGDYSIIYYKGSGKGNPRLEKEKIIEYIDKNKSSICEQYCLSEKGKGKDPLWIKQIEKFFSLEPKMSSADAIQKTGNRALPQSTTTAEPVPEDMLEKLKLRFGSPLNQPEVKLGSA